MKKSTVLRNLINSKETSFLMEAHNGISAKIVEDVGFSGIWASGLTISASLGMRDNNELSYTEVCNICEYMSKSTNIPILVDGDTGFGNFNNFGLLVRKLEQIDIAGVCIEDKLFPKTNSFINGERQPLADIDEFCGKIEAGKDTQKDGDFIIVARTEAFITGHCVEEAIERAERYVEAGCDAVLVHSKKDSSEDIDLFMKHWNNKAPIIIVPTKYYTVPTEHFKDLGISCIIWANHNLRASVKSMIQASKEIYKSSSLIDIEKTVAPLNKIFKLQEMDDYLESEKIYLPHISQLRKLSK